MPLRSLTLLLPCRYGIDDDAMASEASRSITNPTIPFHVHARFRHRHGRHWNSRTLVVRHHAMQPRLIIHQSAWFITLNQTAITHLTHRCMPGHATQSRHWSHDHSDACGFAPQWESITITGKSASFCSHASKASMNHRIWDEATPRLLATMRRTLMAMMISAYPVDRQHTIGNIPHRAGTAPVFDATISGYLRCNDVSHHSRQAMTENVNRKTWSMGGNRPMHG